MRFDMRMMGVGSEQSQLIQYLTDLIWFGQSIGWATWVASVKSKLKSR